MEPGTVLRCLLLLLTTAALKCFNIDTKRKWIHALPSSKDSLFGQKVLQHTDGISSWMLVTAPADNIWSRRFGGLHQCEIHPNVSVISCTEIDLTRGRPQKVKGTQPIASLARDASRVLACVQQRKHQFRSITEELNGMCTLFSAELSTGTLLNLTTIVEDLLVNENHRIRRELPRKRAEEFPGDKWVPQSSNDVNKDHRSNKRRRDTEGEQGRRGEDEKEDSGTEIAIVLDGSGSIEHEDFQRAKDFISNMMKTFWEKCVECEFAVVQYGGEIQTEFNLEESRNSQLALQKVQGIKQLGGVTKTASAIHHVLTEIFNEKHGHKEGAMKIIVVLTDGEIFRDAMSLPDVINSPAMEDVERYVIGVSDTFNKAKAKQELELIASDPDDKHLFRMTNYSALDGLLSMLQQKIIQVEAEEFPGDKWVPQSSNDVNKDHRSNKRRKDTEGEQGRRGEDEKDSGTEIAIVLDGSGSIEHEDFQRAKDFISNMMKTFWEKCVECEFAVVQYGGEIQTEFNLEESRNSQLALQKVQGIKQLGGVTKTASAIHHVLTEIFNEKHGHKEGAMKIIVVLTDGEIFRDPMSLPDVINSPAMEDVERYVIGVSDTFNKTKAKQELELIASDPDDKHLFRMTNYSALDGLLSMLQQKIIRVEVEDLLVNENHRIRRELPRKRAEEFPGDKWVPQSSNDVNKDHRSNKRRRDTEGEQGRRGEDEKEDSGTEIVIVLDGSGSIEHEDFQRAKDFISNMMKTFWEKCVECEFAVVQYGGKIQTEFNLEESRNSQLALQKVQGIKQLGEVTKTASAIHHVLTEIFNEKHGHKEGAMKIIVVLTDGEIFRDPMSLPDVINSPAMEDVERYVIGVSDTFNKTKAKQELELIASDPDDKHLFRVTNYSALDGLLSMLQQKIIRVEGTKGEALQFELAQTGFSAQMLEKQALLVGAVGAFDWSGGLVLYDTEDTKVAFLNESHENTKTAKYGYLGYSVAVVQGKQGPLYVSGAPRHSNKGKVLVFEKDTTTYHLLPYLEGEQVGSYFGSELCPLDVDNDGMTDYLLVAAPFYHIRGEEGRVYVYRFDKQDTFTFVKNLGGLQQYSFARFGFALASIGDINRDGYSDVAVGAPLEGHLLDPDSFGSIYIYNTDTRGIMDSFSQRIKAADIDSKLRYFGQSIDGGLDLTRDGLIDITVGSFGKICVLRSRPVIKLKAELIFSPDKVLIWPVDNTIQAQLCFKILSPFSDKERDIQKSYITYRLELDVTMEQKRITFESREHSKEEKLRITESYCAVHSLTVLPCDQDCFTNITITVSYSLENTDEMRDLPAPFLDKSEPTQASFQLPYKRNCNKTICVADLKLTTHLSEEELRVGLTKDLTMDLSLANTGDDSYLTTLLMMYPKNLQFRKILESPSPITVCAKPVSVTSSLSSMTCKIGHPVFKKSVANFSVIWQLDEAKFTDPDSTATISINVTSTNEGAETISEQRNLPVKHCFSAVLTKLTPDIYVNISQGSTKTKGIEFKFNINGENPYEVPVLLKILIPVEIKDRKVMSLKEVRKSQNSTQCEILSQTLSPLNQTEDSETMWSCEVAECQCIQCIIRTDTEDITVWAELALDSLQEIVEEKAELLISGEIHFNKKLYWHPKAPRFMDEITLVLLKDKVSKHLLLSICSTIGGFLLLALIIVVMYKCGFFKRTYKDLRAEQADEPKEEQKENGQEINSY
ncbi:integrin alpha-E isoform X3 [Rhinatrema bivittatum]|uniref:integrin alpha-E isoform X3 n=1 Tax=Rhinatrema bivittatum TaxID=194408 RepID=UPI00112C8165|nr:integrin alpha-E isoform X3 [Rhinatrema bivittatum]